MMPDHYPVFVYGTLRPGMSNHHWFAGKDANRVDATIQGFELVSNGNFPYLLPAHDASARVLGTLVFVDATDWAEVSAALDELEGTDPAHPEHDDNLYNRTLHKVETTDGTAHTAWVYIPPAKNHASLRKQYAVIGGEWR